MDREVAAHEALARSNSQGFSRKMIANLENQVDQGPDQLYLGKARKHEYTEISSEDAAWNIQKLKEHGKVLISSPSSDAGTSFSSASSKSLEGMRFDPTPEANSEVRDTRSKECAQMPAIATVIPIPTSWKPQPYIKKGGAR